MSLHPTHALQATPAAVSLDELTTDLNRSVNHAIRHRSYTRCVVLAFHWANDDMGVGVLEQKLLETFRKIYNYDLSKWVIPLVNSEMEMVNKIGQWFKSNQGDGVLRIVVYSGHARAAGPTATTWMLGGRANTSGVLQGPTCDWWRIRYFLKDFAGDTCYIFDCCSGGSLALGDDTGDELLASCGWEGSSSASTNWCLTQALIDTLVNLNGYPATLAQIYATMFSRAHQNQIEACPVHVPNREKPSVTLSSFGVQRKLSRGTEACPDSKVAISVTVRSDMPHNLASWELWLAQNIPPEVVNAGVRVEGVFRGSCVLLLTIPVEIWTMMPRGNPAYTFVAHVKSTFIPLPQQSIPLAIRPAAPPAEENSPS